MADLQDDRTAGGAQADTNVQPDTKDWTWTLQRRCLQCGFDARLAEAQTISGRTVELTAPWQEVLRRPDVARRPSPAVWSPLEYGCHVRDVCRVFEGRVRLMLDVDEPRFPDWDQDETALAERYGEQEPSTVAGELAESARQASAAFGRVGGDQWGRKGLRSNGSQFTVLTLGQYFLHDLAHHLIDVGVDELPQAWAPALPPHGESRGRGPDAAR
ncbi:DinB family protein [Pedococcus sp. 5OH_020]|uniref:DinB family protein n=1 Tax=Pedococcus sp. 5OH_020 TaxID=2989814 RepID=UPI0022E9D046|nr:DinB family protein [Pedococcus sp. 5OH_020]